MTWSVAVAGATGYAGGEVLRLLLGHPDITITTVTGNSTVGQTLSNTHPHLLPLADMVVQPTTAQALSGHDLVIFALPHGQSGALTQELADRGEHPIMVDCAADHRLTSGADWEAYYGTPAAEPWTYGMPELFHQGETAAKQQRHALAQASTIAVPGCNVTAVTLAIQPAILAGLIDTTHLVATLAVGYSGAGRSLKPHLLASEALGNIAPYQVGGIHRHIPEIVQNLAVAGAGADTAVTFTPVLVPASRGILATVVAPLNSSRAQQSIVDQAYQVYADEPLIHVLTDTWPTTGPIIGTGQALVSATVDAHAGTLTALCAIDNLGKGTAAAAIQSMNLALGVPELTGVPQIGVAP